MMGESCDVAARHSRSYQGPGRILCSREAFWLRCCFCFSTLVQRRFSPKMLSRARAYRAPSLFAKALQLRRRSLAACVQAIQLGSSAKRSEEHTSELQSLMRISYAVFCLKKKQPKQSLRY